MSTIDNGIGSSKPQFNHQVPTCIFRITPRRPSMHATQASTISDNGIIGWCPCGPQTPVTGPALSLPSLPPGRTSTSGTQCHCGTAFWPPEADSPVLSAPASLQHSHRLPNELSMSTNSSKRSGEPINQLTHCDSFEQMLQQDDKAANSCNEVSNACVSCMHGRKTGNGC